MQKLIKVTTDKTLPLTNTTPNIMLWGWIRSGLGLCGVDIMIYAYLFAIAGMNGNGDYISMSELSEWVGLSRQAVSRRIDNLPTVIKTQSQDSIDGRFYTHNHYTLQTDILLQLCNEAGSEVMEDFNNSIKHIITLYFPEKCVKKIKKVLDTLTDDLDKIFGTTSISAKTLIRVANILETADENQVIYKGEIYNTKEFMNLCKNVSASVTKEYNDKHEVKVSDLNVNYMEPVEDTIDLTPEITESITVPTTNSVTSSIDSNIVTENTSVTTSSTTKHRINKMSGEALRQRLGKPKPTEKSTLLPKKKKETKKSGKVSREETLIMWREMNAGFVATEFNNDQFLLNLLDSFAGNVVQKGELSAFRWQLILDDYKGLPLDAVIEDVKKSVKSGWSSSGYTLDKHKEAQAVEQQRVELHKVADNYITTITDCSVELNEYIHKYVDMLCDTASKGGYKKPDQLRGILSALDRYPTIDLKLAVVKNSYEGSYKKLYASEEVKEIMKSIGTSTSDNSISIDMKEKKTIIDKFIEDEYLFLLPDIKTNLLEYINSNVGRTMTADTFSAILKDLLHYTPMDSEFAIKIKEATTKQYKYLCNTDWNMTNRIHKKGMSIETVAANRRHGREAMCIKEWQRHPDKATLFPDHIIQRFKELGL